MSTSYSKQMAGGIAALALSVPFGSAGAPSPAYRGPVPVKSTAISAPQIKYLLGISSNLKRKFSDPGDAIYSRVQRSYAPATAVPAANGYSLKLVGWQI